MFFVLAEGESSKDSSDPPEVEKPFQCEDCKKFFTTRDALTRHVYRYKNAASYNCPICDEKFHTEHQVKNHSLAHVKEGPFKCKGCDGTFEHPFYLIVHQKSHSDMDRGVKII